MPWYWIAPLIIVGLYALIWIVCAVKILLDNDDGNVNPLSFWRANARLLWRVLWTALQVKRIKWRHAQAESNKELRAELEKRKQELVRWAFKDPDSFLGDKGVKRSTEPYAP
ncbi:MAG TPA: hypothetical protein VGK73_17505 [Polyangiaceae bacterium]